MKLAYGRCCLSDRVKQNAQRDDGEIKMYPDKDVVSGVFTLFTRLVWSLILHPLCGISKGGLLASSLIRAVSLERHQEQSMVDSAANQAKQQQNINVKAPEQGCQPEEDVENRVTQAASGATTTIAEIMAEDLPYSRNNCDRGCGDTDEHSCRY